MSSKDRRIFSLVALLLFVSLVCFANGASAGKSDGEARMNEFIQQQAINNSRSANR